MSGLLGYPRSESDGPPELLGFLEALDDLRHQRQPETAGPAALDSLRVMVDAGLVPPGEAVEMACELRDLGLAAWLNDARDPKVMPPVHWDAMRLCAGQWLSINDVANGGQAATLAQAIGDHWAAKAGSTALRDASERLGLVAAVHHLSALLGRDIGAGIDALPGIGGTKYRGHLAPDGSIAFFEGGGPYNVNICVQVTLPGCSKPITLVVEAKGGTSPIKDVGFAGGRIRQDHVDYPYSRALFMAKDAARTAQGRLRRATGRAIVRASLGKTLMSLGARGMMDTGYANERLFTHPI